MTARELIELLEAVEDKDQEVEIMNVYGDLGPVESVDQENGKIVMY